MDNRSSWKKDKLKNKNSKKHTVDGPKRVILLLDVDCYEAQLWMRELRPDLIGKDIPVVAINPDGIILAVNYTAKSLGVLRGKGRRALRDARALCRKAGTELVEINAEKRFGNVNSFLPLTESNRILNSISNWFEMWNRSQDLPMSITIERTCRDEFYIDVTDIINKKYYSCTPTEEEIENIIRLKDHPNKTYNGQPTTQLEGRNRKITGEELSDRIKQVYHPLKIKPYFLDELRLVHGAVIANSIIQYIEDEIKYQVSAGVGHSKLIAKLACGLNKPKGICIMTNISLPRLSKKISFQDLRGFGKKTGNRVQKLLSSKWGKNVKFMDDVIQASNDGIDLAQVFKKLGFLNFDTRASDLYNRCHFRDSSLVTSKVHSNNINTRLSFKSGQRKPEFKEGVTNLAQDMEQRINYCKMHLGRIPKKLTVRVQMFYSRGVKPCPRNFCIPLPLPEETKQFVRHGSIRRYILDYIEANSLNWKNVFRIHVTARNIKEVDPYWRFFAYDSDERDVGILWPTDDESESETDSGD